jgi:hypothetical protein
LLISGLWLENFNIKSATIFLLLVFSGDLLFFTLQIINIVSPILNRDGLFNLWTPRGYPEIYQYIKFIWIIILIVRFSYKTHSYHFIAWIIIFTFFLLDDSLEIHEAAGGVIAQKLSFSPPFSLRLQDFGELFFVALMGILLFLILMWAYRRGSKRFRKISQDFVLLILILVFFGVFFDLVQAGVDLGARLNYLLGIVEDGGEMLAVSLIVWYSFILNIRDYDSENYLIEHVFPGFSKRFS